jgi:hypothetical protein
MNKNYLTAFSSPDTSPSTIWFLSDLLPEYQVVVVHNSFQGLYEKSVKFNELGLDSGVDDTAVGETRFTTLFLSEGMVALFSQNHDFTTLRPRH